MSIIAFTVGVIGSIFVYSLGKVYDKILGLWFMFISCMQLVDFFLWRNQKCDLINYITSIAGIILNHLQPIVLGIIILCVNTELTNQDIHYILWILLAYLCVIVPYTWQCIEKTQCTLKNENNHMDWKWNRFEYHNIAYFVYLLVCYLLFFGFVPVYGILFARVNLLSFILSFFIYGNEMGNMWCFFSVLLPICYYLFPSYLLYKYFGQKPGESVNISGVVTTGIVLVLVTMFIKSCIEWK
jgi:hypothetical protein